MTPSTRLTTAGIAVGCLLALVCTPGCGTTQVTLPEGERLVESESRLITPFGTWERRFKYEGETEGPTVVESD